MPASDPVALARPDPSAAPTRTLVRHRLENGLRVVLHPDDRLPLVTVNLWYHVGSKDERPGLTGFAHLFEHMLFQGSEHVPGTGHFAYVQQVGGVANGSTWYDRTNYFETLPSHHLDLGLWLESDRMGFLLPALDQAKLETQRSVVMNERRQRVDNQPYGRASERLHELLFPPDHPYHWPVIGYMDDIRAATLDDVRSFFTTHYSPANAVLTLAGRLEPEDAAERVERWFGPLEGRPAPPAVDPPDPSFTGERRDTLSDDVQVARLYVSWLAPTYGTDAWYAGDLLTRVLAQGKASVLHEDLVYRREIARNVGSYLLPTELASAFTVVATANPDRELDRLEDELRRHVVRIADRGPREEELERAKNLALHELHSDLQTFEVRADLISQCTTMFDDPERAFGEPERYAAVTSDDVRRFARERLVEGGRAVVRVVPREPGKAGPGSAVEGGAPA